MERLEGGSHIWGLMQVLNWTQARLDYGRSSRNTFREHLWPSVTYQSSGQTSTASVDGKTSTMHSHAIVMPSCDTSLLVLLKRWIKILVSITMLTWLGMLLLHLNSSYAGENCISTTMCDSTKCTTVRTC